MVEKETSEAAIEAIGVVVVVLIEHMHEMLVSTASRSPQRSKKSASLLATSETTVTPIRAMNVIEQLRVDPDA